MNELFAILMCLWWFFPMWINYCSVTFAATKPEIHVMPLGIGGKEDPARLIFDGVEGDGIVTVLTCPNCNASFEGYLPLNNEEEVSE